MKNQSHSQTPLGEESIFPFKKEKEKKDSAEPSANHHDSFFFSQIFINNGSGGTDVSNNLVNHSYFSH